MNDYIICVPSYKRPKICKERTLTTLKMNNIDNKKINVYVASYEEYENYKNEIPNEYYNKLIIGVIGLVNQRNFIQKNNENNKHIVMIDDDIEYIDFSLSNMFKNKSLHNFIIEAFDICYKEKSYIWGLYPVFNPYFRKNRQEISKSLKYIVGAFYGIINRNDNYNLQLDICKKFDDNKEDVERTIKYFLEDGVVIRFNKIGFKTKYFGSVGGMGNFKNRLENNKNVCYEIKNKYSNLGKIKIRKNGMTEFVLNNSFRI